MPSGIELQSWAFGLGLYLGAWLGPTSAGRQCIASIGFFVTQGAAALANDNLPFPGLADWAIDAAKNAFFSRFGAAVAGWKLVVFSFFEYYCSDVSRLIRLRNWRFRKYNGVG